VIRVNVSELFTITATLIDETTGLVYSDGEILYDIRQQPDDLPLSPALYGLLVESDIIQGIYSVTLSINEAGSYIAYITCSGFTPSIEEIIVDTVVISSPGCYTPEVISESFGSINLVVSSDNIKLSTEVLIPIISTSVSN